MTEEEIKKIFRSIQCTKKEMQLRHAFQKDVAKMNFPTASIEASIEREVAKLQQKLDLADEMMSRLDAEERLVLTARYVLGVRWEYIEFKTNYSVSQSQRIHNRAIRKLSKMNFSGDASIAAEAKPAAEM